MIERESKGIIKNFNSLSLTQIKYVKERERERATKNHHLINRNLLVFTHFYFFKFCAKIIKIKKDKVAIAFKFYFPEEEEDKNFLKWISVLNS